MAVTQSCLSPPGTVGFLGAGPLPVGAGAGRDAPRMQTSTRKFYGIFCALGSVFQHDDGRNEFLCALSRLQLSADKNLSVTTPTESFCKPLKEFGSRKEKTEGFWIKPIPARGQTSIGRRRGIRCPQPRAPSVSPSPRNLPVAAGGKILQCLSRAQAGKEVKGKEKKDPLTFFSFFFFVSVSQACPALAAEGVRGE